MYSKLVVSSLESRAINGDQRAIAELVSRSKQGMKRARLALERIANRKPTIDPENNAQKLSVTARYSTGQLIKTKCGHKGYWDLNCSACRADYESGFEPLIAEELEEIKTNGYRTAQQMDNEKRGMK